MNKRAIEIVEKIRSLEIFADLNSIILSEIADSARILNFKKGKDLFAAGDESGNFYLVIDGVVKLYLIDQDGEEALIEILQNGDFINDIFSKTHQVSVKAIKNSEILVLANSAIKNLLKNNSQFALNLLSEFSKRNSILIESMTNLKLIDSKQKIGKFILGMAFEKGGQKSSSVELKFDKANLAAYLGINPETLSRSLKKLSNDGEIKVQRSKITLLDKSSLCRYCDEKIAKKCGLTKEDFCSQ